MEHDKGSTDDQQEEIARKAEIAERRRQTRRENLERERLQDERLAQETRGLFLTIAPGYLADKEA